MEERRHTLLMLRHRPSRIENQSLRVHKVDPRPGLRLRKTLQLEEAHQLHRDTYTRGACTQEENAVFAEWSAGGSGGEFGCVDEAGEDDGACALDIVVEERVAVAELFEVEEGVVG